MSVMLHFYKYYNTQYAWVCVVVKPLQHMDYEDYEIMSHTVHVFSHNFMLVNSVPHTVLYTTDIIFRDYLVLRSVVLLYLRVCKQN